MRLIRLEVDYKKLEKRPVCRNRVTDSNSPQRPFAAIIIVYKTYVTHRQLKRIE